MRILIVGAGIVGLSLARSALARGHKVVVLDQAAIPNPDAASFDEHRLIRFQYGAAEGYARMVAEAFPAWERLWAEIGARHCADTGSLSVSLRTGDYSDLSRQALERARIAHEVLPGAELVRRYPHLALPAHALGLLCHPGGPLYADRIMRDLAHLVRGRGARLIERTRVVAVDHGAATVTTAGGETLAGDLVVVAAGAWLGELLPAEFPAVPVVRQVLCYVRPPASQLAAWQRGPALVVIGDSNVYALPPTDGSGLKFGCGALRRSLPPAHGFSEPLASGLAAIEAFRPFIADPDGFVPLRLKVGYYVMDATRRFRLQKRNRRLIVTNCDGQMFKFGPLIGERLQAMIDGEQSFEATERWIAGYA